MAKVSAALAREFLNSLAAAESRVTRERTRRLSNVDLTLAQAQILSVLHEHGPIGLKELNEFLTTETPPSRVVSVLVDRKLVHRQDTATDRRRLDLTLTAAGKKQIQTIRRVERAVEQWAVKRLKGKPIPTAHKVVNALCDK